MTALDWLAASILVGSLAIMLICDLLDRRRRRRMADPHLEPLSPRALAGLIDHERERQPR